MSLDCPECAAANQPDSQFCSKCGAKLQSGSDSTITFSEPVEGAEESQIDLEALGYDEPVLVVVKGIGVGQVFDLVSDEVLIGRDPGNDIFLDDITVSRKHAQIERRGTKHVIKDTGSLNGTYLNKNRVDEAYMADKDELQIGKFRMIFLNRTGVEHGSKEG